MFQAGTSLSKMANAIKQTAIEKAKKAHLDREKVMGRWLERKRAECEPGDFKAQEHRVSCDLLLCAHLTSTVEDVFVGKIFNYLTEMNCEITQEIFDKTVEELLKPGAFWKNVHDYMR
jgi:hypothetical protein